MIQVTDHRLQTALPRGIMDRYQFCFHAALWRGDNRDGRLSFEDLLGVGGENSICT